MTVQCEVNKTIRGIGEGFVKDTAQEVFKILKIKNANISVAIVDDKEMKKLNKKYRGKNKTTDVLSFGERDLKDKFFGFGEKEYLGEIIISYPETKKQAKEDKDSIKNVFSKLLAHGILHLLGYEHEGGGKKAEDMFKLQKKILDKIK